MAPPSRLWNPTSTGDLLSSAFCGAPVVAVPPPVPAVPPEAVVADAAVVAEPAVVAAPVPAVVPSELLSSLPHAAKHQRCGREQGKSPPGSLHVDPVHPASRRWPTNDGRWQNSHQRSISPSSRASQLSSVRNLWWTTMWRRAIAFTRRPIHGMDRPPRRGDDEREVMTTEAGRPAEVRRGPGRPCNSDSEETKLRILDAGR